MRRPEVLLWADMKDGRPRQSAASRCTMQERHGSQRWFWGATFDRSFGSSEAYSQQAEAGKLIWETCCLAIDEG